MVAETRRTQAGESPPTILDVAARADVSRQTVSNVLNAPERVAPETRARVEAAITALGYRPHRQAQSLKTGSSGLIGYQIARVRSGWTHPLLDGFVHALADAARQSGYHPLIFTAQAGEDALAAQEHLLATHTVDGLVLTDIDYRDARVVALARKGVPFVAFGRAEVDEAHDWVDVDGQAGTRLAVEHVITGGCTPVAFLGWPIGSATGDRRAAGYREALEGAGLSLEDDLDVRCGEDIRDASVAAGRLLDLPERPAAIVAVSDTLAAGALHAAYERGLVVGGDVAITGFDDSVIARAVNPPLTTVRQPLETAALRIVERLLARVAGEPPRAEGVLLEPELVVRASTVPSKPRLRRRRT